MSAADPADTTSLDTPAALPAAMPTPVTGAGSTDLVTDSDDPAELRALLERARERLSFYESFDRMIGEQMRRAGEMMAETVTLREQAAQAARDREAIDRAVREERERHRAVLEGALSEVRDARPVIDAMVARLQGAIEELGAAGSTPAPPAPAPAPAPAPPTNEEDVMARATDTEAETEPLAADIPDEVLTEEPPVETPVTDKAALRADPAAEAPSGSIEVLAHGVPSATTAIGLQALLRGIDTVERVDAREFADGELRLHVECSGPITDEALTGWLRKHGGSLVSRTDKAIELTFA